MLQLVNFNYLHIFITIDILILYKINLRCFICKLQNMKQILKEDCF